MMFCEKLSRTSAVRSFSSSVLFFIILAVVLDNRAVYLNKRVPAGKIDSALIVNLCDLNDNLISYVYNVLNLFDALNVKL